MRCEIETRQQRLEGPAGPVTIRSHCKVHNFVRHGEAMVDACPIGQIEAARDEALAALRGADNNFDMSQMMTSDVTKSSGDTITLPGDPPPKRTRKPKAEPSA